MTSITEIIEEEFGCAHENTSVVKASMSNGAIMVKHQCLRCGWSGGNALPHKSLDLERIPLRDEQLPQDWYALKNERRAQLRLQLYPDQNEWWTVVYEPYLQSDHWKALRRRVLSRDSFLCQNCFRHVLDSTAHIHHLSYKGLRETGESFAFECVTLCRHCHERVHPHMGMTP